MTPTHNKRRCQESDAGTHTGGETHTREDCVTQGILCVLFVAVRHIDSLVFVGVFADWGVGRDFAIPLALCISHDVHCTHSEHKFHSITQSEFTCHSIHELQVYAEAAATQRARIICRNCTECSSWNLHAGTGVRSHGAPRLILSTCESSRKLAPSTMINVFFILQTRPNAAPSTRNSSHLHLLFLSSPFSSP